MDDRVAEIIEEILDDRGFATKEDVAKINAQLGKIFKDEQFKQMVAGIMLSLMPEFNKRISSEIKSHLVALAEFVLENFKEKDD